MQAWKISRHEVFHALDLKWRASLKAWPGSKFRSVISSKNVTVSWILLYFPSLSMPGRRGLGLHLCLDNLEEVSCGYFPVKRAKLIGDQLKMSSHIIGRHLRWSPPLSLALNSSDVTCAMTTLSSREQTVWSRELAVARTSWMVLHAFFFHP